MGRKNSHKMLLSHRSAEVQEKTAKIPGVFLKWGISIIALFFIGLLIAGARIHFDKETTVKAKPLTDNQLLILVRPGHLIKPQDTLSVNWQGTEYKVQAISNEKTGVIVELNQQNAALAMTEHDTISVLLHENYSLLEIVFSDVKRSFVR